MFLLINTFAIIMNIYNNILFSLIHSNSLSSLPAFWMGAFLRGRLISTPQLTEKLCSCKFPMFFYVITKKFFPTEEENNYVADKAKEDDYRSHPCAHHH
jgi:hypothetical protein